MIRIRIDQKELETAEGTTVLEAAGAAGISIPTLCHLQGHGNHPSCMVCLVKDNKTGNLLPSCSLRVVEGMDLSSDLPEVLQARREALELLFSDHVGDCEAPCSLACPAGMNIPRMNRLIGEGKFTLALEVVKEDIALPHILGYICPAPCEKACRRRQIDQPVSVCMLKRITAVEGEDVKAKALPSVPEDKAKKVAVIGAGPAGMAAAYYLARRGYRCTLFDQQQEAGGSLRSLLGPDKLPGEIIDQETAILKSMGILFRMGQPIDTTYLKETLKTSFDAIILATGDIATTHLLQDTVETGKNGILVNEQDLSTAVEGIFVCGSAVRAQKMAVRSVAQGKQVALSVDHYLQGKTYIREEKMFNCRFDKLMMEEYPEYLKEANEKTHQEPASGWLKGFSAEEAIKEAGRCMHCDCRKAESCKLRDWAHTYRIDRKHYQTAERRRMTRQVQHHQLIYEREKCIKCGLCTEISLTAGETWGLAFEGRGIDVSVNVPLGIGFEKGITRAAAQCAASCPTGALSLKQVSI